MNKACYFISSPTRLCLNTLTHFVEYWVTESNLNSVLEHFSEHLPFHDLERTPQVQDPVKASKYFYQQSLQNENTESTTNIG